MSYFYVIFAQIVYYLTQWFYGFTPPEYITNNNLIFAIYYVSGNIYFNRYKYEHHTAKYI